MECKVTSNSYPFKVYINIHFNHEEIFVNIIIAGAGGVGQYITARLVTENHNITVIDTSLEVLSELAQEYDIQTVHGSASSIDTLMKANINSADIIIAATDSDEANMIACLIAHSCNEKVQRIARVRELASGEYSLPEPMRKIFHKFINPDHEAAKFLYRLFDVPGASEVIDLVDGRVRVIGVNITQESIIVGNKLKNLPRSPETLTTLVVAIVRSGQLIIPRGDDRVEAGDTIYLVLEPHQTDQIFENLGHVRHPINNVMIWGGGSIGKELAKSLAERDCSVKIIESDPELCQSLADELNNVLVLQGEGTDYTLINEESVSDVDVFVSATSDDEDNILAALLAKRLGARIGAVVVAKKAYIDLIPAIGLDITVSPRIAAASSILNFVRSIVASSAVSIHDDTAEVLELIAKEKSKIVLKPLREIDIPSGVIIAAIVSGDSVCIPTGDSVISPGNKVVVFANRLALPKLEKLL
jgi:trk system potassium uptake protein